MEPFAAQPLDRGPYRPGGVPRIAALMLFLLGAPTGCQREIDACRRLGTRLDSWRTELEQSLNAEAISRHEWECKVGALEKVDRETTRLCEEGPVMLYDVVADRDRRFEICEAEASVARETPER